MSTTENLERGPEELGGRFEFSAGIAVEVDYWATDDQPVTSAWYTVHLPHQCDSWEITRTKNRDEAISEMEAFVREAEAALVKLREAT